MDMQFATHKITIPLTEIHTNVASWNRVMSATYHQFLKDPQS
jgi:hypothetical protein